MIPKINLRGALGLLTGALTVCISLYFNSYSFSFGADINSSWMGFAIGCILFGIQISGNDTENTDIVFTYIWYASYVFGISSNSFGIFSYLGSGIPFAVALLIALPLGFIIEVLPERIILLSLGRKVKFNAKSESQKPSSSLQTTGTFVPAQKSTRMF